MHSSKNKDSRSFGNMTDENISKKVLTRMRHHFKVVMGLKISREQLSKRIGGVRNQQTVYFIEDTVSVCCDSAGQ